MANVKSAIKNAKKAEKRHLLNQSKKSQFKTAIKKALTSAQKGEDASELISEAFSKLDKAAKIGTIHKNQASRRKSRLVKKVKALSTQTSQHS